MAGQKIKIDIGTQYNGQGVNNAKVGLGGLSKAAQQASGALGQVGRVTGKMSAMFGGLPGPIGNAIRSLEGLTQGISMLKSGMGGVVLAGVGFLAFMLKKQKAYEDAKKAAIELRKAQRAARIAEEIAHDERMIKKEEEKKKKAEEYHKKLKELTKANWELYEAEKERQSANNDLHLDELKNKNKLAIAQESDPHKKQMLQAEGSLKEIEFIGKANIKAAKQALAEEMAKLKGMQSKVGTEDDPVKAQVLTREIEAQLKRVRTARTRVENAQENASSSKAMAQEVIKQLKEELDAQKLADETAKEEAAKAKEAKQLEEYNAALKVKELWEKIDEKYLQNEKDKEELARVNEQLKVAVREVKRIEENQRTLEKGVNVNNNVDGNGFNGQNRYGQYDWNKNRDADGNLTAAGVQRAGRMAEGADRDKASKREGSNISQRRAERLAELEGKNFDERNGGSKMDKRERKELDNLRRWAEQKEGDKAKDNLNNLQARQQELTNSIQQALKDLTVKVQEVNGLK